MERSTSHRIKKQHVAVVLAVLAVLSYAYSMSMDIRGEHMNAGIAGNINGSADTL